MKNLIKKLFPTAYNQIRFEGYQRAMEVYRPYYDYYQANYPQSNPNAL